MFARARQYKNGGWGSRYQIFWHYCTDTDKSVKQPAKMAFFSVFVGFLLREFWHKVVKWLNISVL